MAYIETGLLAILVAALQLAAAPCCFAVLPGRSRRLLAMRELRRTVTPALAVAVGAGALWWLVAGRGRPSLAAIALGLLVIFGSLPAGAVVVGIRAGLLEAAGRLRPARRLGLEAGGALFRGNLVLLAGIAGFAFRAPRISTVPLAIAGGAFLAAGFLALLGGLTGKPRPAFKLAATGQLVGLALTLHGAGATLWA